MRPNIVWLISEDLSPTGAEYGDHLARTPAMDRIAREGVRFANGFATAPVCAPSRFSLLTGVHPTSCGPAHHMSSNAHLPVDVPMYPTALKQAGYYVTNFSKSDYNCDADLDALWDDRSIDAHWRNRPADTAFFSCFNIIATHESSLFREDPSYVDPDDVLLPPYLPDTAAIRRDFARYYTARAKTDAAFADILAQLEEDGLLDSTIVIHSSDHGGCEPRTKRFCYDGGLRVPVVVRVPAAFAHLSPWAAGSVVDTAVSQIDMAPTILALAGAAIPTTMQGRPLFGEARCEPIGLAFGGRDRMDTAYDMVRTVRDERYRYIRNYSPHRPWGQYIPFMFEAEGYRSWLEEFEAGRLTEVQARFWGTKPAEEFYDVQADPFCLSNLIDDPQHAARVTELRIALDEHLIATNDNGFLPEGSAAEGYHESRAQGAFPIRRAKEVADLAILRDPVNVPAFVELLDDEAEPVRWWAAQGLLMLGGAASGAAEAIEQAISDASPHVAIVAAEAAAMLGRPSRALPLLETLLAPTQPTPVRIQAANAANQIGEAARPLLPLLEHIGAHDLEIRTSGIADYAARGLRGTRNAQTRTFDWPRFMASLKGTNRETPGMSAEPLATR